MSKVSIIIPSRNELFLPQTVNDLFSKASGDVEVIAVLDGYWPDPPLKDHKNLIVIHRGRSHGMRAAINAGAAVARGDFLLKCDAHCMFAEGYDEVLQADCADNWMVIPARYSLDAENWAILQTGKSRVDYHYLCFPTPDKEHDAGMHGVVWRDRAHQRTGDPQNDIDDEMSFQGSCWFMSRTHFFDFLHGMSEEGYGAFTQEPQEIGLKTWLGGGEIKVNKKTWYAHLHKGKTYGRMYSLSQREIVRGHRWASLHWMNNRWEDRVHDLQWLIEKFWPVPTWEERWLEDWNRELVEWNKLMGE